MIWGFSSTECPKCNGNGQFSKQVEHKEACNRCKGKTLVNCSYDNSSTKTKGYNIFRGSYFQHISRTCKGGKVTEVRVYENYNADYTINEDANYYYEGEYTCPRCNGTAKQDCSKCSGYGYLTSNKTEYYDDSFCAGKGKVSNFKVMFD